MQRLAGTVAVSAVSAMSAMRALAACAAVAVGAGSAAAASPPVDAAIETLKAVGADAGRLESFCELNKLLQTAGEGAAARKRIAEAVGRVGPDFGTAWKLGEGLEETSADGKAFYAAVDTLAAKCR